MQINNNLQISYVYNIGLCALCWVLLPWKNSRATGITNIMISDIYFVLNFIFFNFCINILSQPIINI